MIRVGLVDMQRLSDVLDLGLILYGVELVCQDRHRTIPVHRIAPEVVDLTDEWSVAIGPEFGYLTAKPPYESLEVRFFRRGELAGRSYARETGTVFSLSEADRRAVLDAIRLNVATPLAEA